MDDYELALKDPHFQIGVYQQRVRDLQRKVKYLEEDIEMWKKQTTDEIEELRGPV